VAVLSLCLHAPPPPPSLSPFLPSFLRVCLPSFLYRRSVSRVKQLSLPITELDHELFQRAGKRLEEMLLMEEARQNMKVCLALCCVALSSNVGVGVVCVTGNT